MASDPFDKELESGSINPGTDSPEEFQELAELVAEALIKGEPRDKVIADLTTNGWEPEAANNLVESVEEALDHSQQVAAAHSSNDDGAMGWLIWIGAILGINLLSYIFDWGFWLY